MFNCKVNVVENVKSLTVIVVTSFFYCLLKHKYAIFHIQVLWMKVKCFNKSLGQQLLLPFKGIKLIALNIFRNLLLLLLGCLLVYSCSFDATWRARKINVVITDVNEPQSRVNHISLFIPSFIKVFIMYVVVCCCCWWWCCLGLLYSVFVPYNSVFQILI